MSFNKSQAPSWWTYSQSVWQQLLTAIPESGLAQVSQQQCWQKIYQGSSNQNYRLRATFRDFFVQIVTPQRLAYTPTKNFAQHHQQLFSDNELSDWMVYCWYESPELRVYDWCETNSAEQSLFDNEAYQQQLINFLARIHQKKPNLATINIQQYLQKYYHLAVMQQPDKKIQLEQLLKQGLLLAQDYSASCLCHNDLSPENLMFTKSLKIIDWEYAAIGDPMFDLAGLSLNFQLNTQQEKRLILNYSEKLQVKIELEKFRKMKKLYQIVGELWSV